MSLTAIVALLQSALLLLSAAQSASNLPQSFRDSAIAVAQQAISEATLSLSSPQTTTNSAVAMATTTSQYFTLPNGTVVDSSGNIIRTAPTANALTTVGTTASNTTAPMQTSATNNDVPTLSISIGQTSVATSSAYLSWTTNVSARSNIFLTPTPVSYNAQSTQVFQSPVGCSTEGFVNIPRLTPGTQYSYTIEATNCTTRYDQKMSGVFTTDACIPNLQLRPDTSSLESGLASFIATYSTGCALDPNTTISYQTFDHNGNPVQGSNTSVDSTIGWNSSHGASGGSISGSVFTWAPGWELPIVATTSPVTFHVTIGNTAQTLTVTARNK